MHNAQPVPPESTILRIEIPGKVRTVTALISGVVTLSWRIITIDNQYVAVLSRCETTDGHVSVFFIEHTKDSPESPHLKDFWEIIRNIETNPEAIVRYYNEIVQERALD